MRNVDENDRSNRNQGKQRVHDVETEKKAISILYVPKVTSVSVIRKRAGEAARTLFLKDRRPRKRKRVHVYQNNKVNSHKLYPDSLSKYFQEAETLENLYANRFSHSAGVKVSRHPYKSCTRKDKFPDIYDNIIYKPFSKHIRKVISFASVSDMVKPDFVIDVLKVARALQLSNRCVLGVEFVNLFFFGETILQEIFKCCVKLETLGLERCKIRLSSFGFLVKKSAATLKVLNISECCFSGCDISDAVSIIPKHSLKLNKLIMKKIYLNTSSLLQVLKVCDKIRYLDVSNCDGLDEMFLVGLQKYCFNLNFLLCKGVNFVRTEKSRQSVFSFLGTNKNIREINFRDCEWLVDEDLQGLTYSAVAGVPIFSGGKFFLKKIVLSGCSNITDLSLTYLSACSNLEMIDISNCINIGDYGFRALFCLGKVKNLYIGGCAKLTDSAFKLSRNDPVFPLLKVLRCNGIRITNNIILDFFSSLPARLQVLEAPGMEHMQDACVRMFVSKSCQSVSTLNLGNNISVTAASLGSVGNKCVNLSYLSLAGCKHVDNYALYALKKARLRYINLSRTPVSTKGLVAVLTPYLEALDVSQCTNVSDMLLSFMSFKCPNFSYLDVSFTSISSVDGLVFLAKQLEALYYLNFYGTLADKQIVDIDEIETLFPSLRHNLSNYSLKTDTARICNFLDASLDESCRNERTFLTGIRPKANFLLLKSRSDAILLRESEERKIVIVQSLVRVFLAKKTCSILRYEQHKKMIASAIRIQESYRLWKVRYIKGVIEKKRMILLDLKYHWKKSYSLFFSCWKQKKRIFVAWMGYKRFWCLRWVDLQYASGQFRRTCLLKAGFKGFRTLTLKIDPVERYRNMIHKAFIFFKFRLQNFAFSHWKVFTHYWKRKRFALVGTYLLLTPKTYFISSRYTAAVRVAVDHLSWRLYMKSFASWRSHHEKFQAKKLMAFNFVPMRFFEQHQRYFFRLWLTFAQQRIHARKCEMRAVQYFTSKSIGCCWSVWVKFLSNKKKAKENNLLAKQWQRKMMLLRLMKAWIIYTRKSIARQRKIRSICTKIAASMDSLSLLDHFFSWRKIVDERKRVRMTVLVSFNATLLYKAFVSWSIWVKKLIQLADCIFLCVSTQKKLILRRLFNRFELYLNIQKEARIHQENTWVMLNQCATTLQKIFRGVHTRRKVEMETLVLSAKAVFIQKQVRIKLARNVLQRKKNIFRLREMNRAEMEQGLMSTEEQRSLEIRKIDFIVARLQSIFKAKKAERRRKQLYMRNIAARAEKNNRIKKDFLDQIHTQSALESIFQNKAASLIQEAFRIYRNLYNNLTEYYRKIFYHYATAVQKQYRMKLAIRVSEREKRLAFQQKLLANRATSVASLKKTLFVLTGKEIASEINEDLKGLTAKTKEHISVGQAVRVTDTESDNYGLSGVILGTLNESQRKYVCIKLDASQQFVFEPWFSINSTRSQRSLIKVDKFSKNWASSTITGRLVRQNVDYLVQRAMEMKEEGVALADESTIPVDPSPSIKGRVGIFLTEFSVRSRGLSTTFSTKKYNPLVAHKVATFIRELKAMKQLPKGIKMKWFDNYSTTTLSNSNFLTLCERALQVEWKYLQLSRLNKYYIIDIQKTFGFFLPPNRELIEEILLDLSVAENPQQTYFFKHPFENLSAFAQEPVLECSTSLFSVKQLISSNHSLFRRTSSSIVEVSGLHPSGRALREAVQVRAFKRKESSDTLHIIFQDESRYTGSLSYSALTTASLTKDYCPSLVIDANMALQGCSSLLLSVFAAEKESWDSLEIDRFKNSFPLVFDHHSFRKQSTEFVQDKLPKCETNKVTIGKYSICSHKVDFFFNYHSLYLPNMLNGWFAIAYQEGKEKNEYLGMLNSGSKTCFGIIRNIKDLSAEMYFGQFLADYASGVGLLVTGNASYFGNFALGFPEGFGVLISSVETYVGWFREGLYHGKGILSKEESVFCGEFKKGLFHGFGVLTSRDEKYIGYFVEGLKTTNRMFPTGTFFQKGKVVYSGGWLKNARHGSAFSLEAVHTKIKSDVQVEMVKRYGLWENNNLKRWLRYGKSQLMTSVFLSRFRWYGDYRTGYAVMVAQNLPFLPEGVDDDFENREDRLVELHTFNLGIANKDICCVSVAERVIKDYEKALVKRNKLLEEIEILETSLRLQIFAVCSSKRKRRKLENELEVCMRNRVTGSQLIQTFLSKSTERTDFHSACKSLSKLHATQECFVYMKTLNPSPGSADLYKNLWDALIKILSFNEPQPEKYNKVQNLSTISLWCSCSDANLSEKEDIAMFRSYDVKLLDSLQHFNVFTLINSCNEDSFQKLVICLKKKIFNLRMNSAYFRTFVFKNPGFFAGNEALEKKCSPCIILLLDLSKALLKYTMKAKEISSEIVDFKNLKGEAQHLREQILGTKIEIQKSKSLRLRTWKRLKETETVLQDTLKKLSRAGEKKNRLERLESLAKSGKALPLSGPVIPWLSRSEQTIFDEVSLSVQSMLDLLENIHINIWDELFLLKEFVVMEYNYARLYERPSEMFVPQPIRELVGFLVDCVCSGVDGQVEDAVESIIFELEPNRPEKFVIETVSELVDLVQEKEDRFVRQRALEIKYVNKKVKVENEDIELLGVCSKVYIESKEIPANPVQGYGYIYCTDSEILFGSYTNFVDSIRPGFLVHLPMQTSAEYESQKVARVFNDEELKLEQPFSVYCHTADWITDWKIQDLSNIARTEYEAFLDVVVGTKTLERVEIAKVELVSLRIENKKEDKRDAVDTPARVQNLICESWVQYFDKEKKRPYWFNKKLDKSTWRVPKNVKEADWRLVYDYEEKKNYYFNMKTKKALWDRPS
eukprot:snap_masked-scaffold_19-processed-gene-5.2-mRNA-1 protein AED:1.00 eAED:1.00 QI:0/0/0/0/1/1/3/0/2827